MPTTSLKLVNSNFDRDPSYNNAIHSTYKILGYKILRYCMYSNMEAKRLRMGAQHVWITIVHLPTS